MPSQFVIRVVDLTTDEFVEWAPGKQVEKKLVDDLCARVAKKDVGMFKTKAHVVAVVRGALDSLLHELKSEVSAR